jgi:hypothetical protein
VDIDALGADLQAKGVASFAASWSELLEGIAGKTRTLAASVGP